MALTGKPLPMAQSPKFIASFSRVLILLLTVAGVPKSASAEEGYVHGKDHCYYFRAPSGWKMDNTSAKSSGVPMVFYPDGSSWEKSDTVMYTRSAAPVEGASTSAEKIQGQVNAVLEEFREKSPNIKSEKINDLRARSGAKGELWSFSGDTWGNRELVAYFNGPKTVNFFVLSSRNTRDYEKSSDALIELASSYREGNDCVPCRAQSDESPCSAEKPKTEVSAIIARATPTPRNEAEAIPLEERHRKCMAAPKGEEYDQDAARTFLGDSTFFTECAVSFPELKEPFTIYLEIGEAGELQKATYIPQSKLTDCLAKHSPSQNFSPPPVKDCVVKIDMSFKD